ncbi:restriction endonuclease subunit S [Mycoplasma sp. 1018B]|uniref:restriction endonuclease subunit S n=1 Tax=Mycoplasma sp. 1018B TaxID=2967302 RepID=UPI00211B85EE|nr:restriction endonuclease subunit S [Mycoplasma sp. 1018B]UUM19451.1 restriction endonuclease subunit S [Mycoplasma sp. 1018B]
MKLFEELLGKELNLNEKKLSDIANVIVGECITRKEISEKGSFPVISGGVNPLGWYNKYNSDSSITISRAGTAGYIGFVETKYWLTDKCFSVSPIDKKEINTKFLFYYLISHKSNIDKIIKKGTVNTIRISDLKEIKIKYPEIKVQNKIVEILDKFTEYSTELKAELKARDEQYKFYRDKLFLNNNLSTNSNFISYKLEDILISLKTGLNPRDHFKLNTENANNFYLTIKEIISGKIVFNEKTDLINDEAMLKIQSRSNLEKDDILLSSIGTLGKVAIVDIPINNWNCSESIFY